MVRGGEGESGGELTLHPPVPGDFLGHPNLSVVECVPTSDSTVGSPFTRCSANASEVAEPASTCLDAGSALLPVAYPLPGPFSMEAGWDGGRLRALNQHSIRYHPWGGSIPSSVFRPSAGLPTCERL